MIKIAAPVYKYTSESNPTIMLIHKSPKGKPGDLWQISYFLPGLSEQQATPMGDSEFPSLTHALLYAKKQGFTLAERAGDEARVAALFGISVSKGIVNSYWDEYLCSQDSHCSHKKAEHEEKVEAEQEKEAIDSAGTTWVDRDEPGQPTERGEITQLEDGKDTSKNRTQER